MNALMNKVVENKGTQNLRIIEKIYIVVIFVKTVIYGRHRFLQNF